MDIIQSIRFSGYKSFSDNNKIELDFKPYVTTIIGKNNCGKSSAIDVIEPVIDFDKFIKMNNRVQMLYVSFKLDSRHIERGFNKGYSGGGISGDHYTYGMNYQGKRIDCKLKINSSYNQKHLDLDCSNVQGGIDPNTNDYWNTVAGSYRDYYKTYAFRRINAERDIVPENESSNDDVDYNGLGTTNLLRIIVNHSEYDEKLVEETLLNELNKIMFPESVFSNIRIQEIQSGDEEKVWEVFLEENGRRFALSKSGSGLKTIILMLVNLYIIPQLKKYKEKKIIYAFEEIENNLHPALQRRIFEYLYDYAKENDSRIFITTHSHVAINSLYDKENTSLYHVTKENGISHIAKVESYIDKVNILNDLDVKASDLFQSNGIIWVEGPSDRVYINRWLKVFCESELLEGSDYQFLYYGGKLLSHYSTEEIEDLINILTTNRNSAIIIDSDKKRKNSNINKTKQRIRKEFDNKKLFCWITKGKEIENYLSADSINKLFNTNKKQINQYELFPDYINKEYPSFAYSKVKFSTLIAPHIDNENDILDLKKQVNKLYREIQRWNSKQAT